MGAFDAASAALEWVEIVPTLWNVRDPVWEESMLPMSPDRSWCYEDVVVRREDVLRFWKATEPVKNVPRAAETLAIIEPPPAPKRYSTAYTRLMDRAIDEFNITEENQPKAETLSDWFKGETADGWAVSDNLAARMATLLRLPERQKGGPLKTPQKRVKQ